MKREIIGTADGSTTIYLPEWQETYHSKHGAMVEAEHVFIRHGLHAKVGAISVLEVGFGTGLNAWLTALQAKLLQQKVRYVGIEPFPLPDEQLRQMNYWELAGQDATLYKQLHAASWETHQKIHPWFTLQKKCQTIEVFTSTDQFDLVYFDAFGFRVQPEMWSVEVFLKVYQVLKPGGLLVTYACRSVIKKNLIAVGFKVEVLAGPPGKREMIRATKGDV